MKITGAAAAHVLVFPYPAQGHMIPLLDLTHQLASRGLTITVLVTPKNLSLLDPLLSKHSANVHPLVLPFPANTSLPAAVENVQHLPPTSFPSVIRELGDLHDPLLEWFRNHPSPPSAIVSDMFLGWTQHLACRLGIHRYVFSPSGAMALSVIYSLWRDLPQRDDPSDEDAPISFPKLPNSPVYPWRQISRIYRSCVAGESDPSSEFIKDGFRADMTSWGLVVNSFSELERVYLDHLKDGYGHDRVWAVGPLQPPADDKSGPTERGGSSSMPPGDVSSWLDTCGDRTVVYVCFGSQAVLTNEQIEGLALGLEKSGAKFLWCVKEPAEGQFGFGKIPPGFQDRVAERGLVIRGWAPQVLILRHRAVGVFMTHCGWNSALEGIFAGVPMLAWPMTADQFSNATLLVDELGVATRVCEGSGTVPDSDELAQLFAESVGGNRVGSVLTKELRKAALDAIKEGGSSSKDFDEFVSHLSKEALDNGSHYCRLEPDIQSYPCLDGNLKSSNVVYDNKTLKSDVF